MNSLVSVIIPAYNSEKFVVEAVNSVLFQSYSNVEVVVVDDGSTDCTLQKIMSIEDPRLHVFSQVNQGACAARNVGILLSHGKYIKFLDADDVLCPDVIELQVQQIESLNENEIPFGDYNFIDAEGNVFHQNKIDEKRFLAMNQDLWFLSSWDVLISTPLHRRYWLEKVKGFNPRLSGGQESFMHFMLSINGLKFVYFPINTFSYRSHYSATRISVTRTTRCPKFHEVTYRHSAMLDAIMDKYGNKPTIFSTIISQSYFNDANAFFCHNMEAEGRYLLNKSLSTPRLYFPKYKKRAWLGRGFVVIGRLIGYSNFVSIINMMSNLRIRITKKEVRRDQKMQMVLGNIEKK